MVFFSFYFIQLALSHAKKPFFRADMSQQEARETRQKEHNARQEQRIRALQHQFHFLQMEVQACTSPVPEPLSSELEPPDPKPTDVDITPQGGDRKGTGNQFHISSGQSRFFEPKWENLQYLHCQIMMTVNIN